MGGISRTLDNRINYSTNCLVEMNFPAIVGVEAAAHYWGFGTYDDSINILMIPDDSKEEGTYEFIESGDLNFLFVPEIDETHLVQISDTVKVVDKAQCVCDVIRYDRALFHVEEIVMDAEEDTDEAFHEELHTLLREYGLEERFMELYEDAVDAFENQ